VCFERIAFVLDAPISVEAELIHSPLAVLVVYYFIWAARMIQDFMQVWLECASSVNYNSSL